MDVETLGHAGLLIRDDAGAPVLFTDPWVIGSCYWRSWWLQHYPGPDVLDELKRTSFCFITHEHPDHFHTASIRVLGTGPRYLSPELPEEHIASYLSAQGYQASVVPAFRWKALRAGVRVLSIPLFNDDSALLIDMPGAVLVNLNDSKPRPGQLRTLRAWLDRDAAGKRRILLSSYSPASIVNSFLRGEERVSLRHKVDYVRSICAMCDLLGIDDFMPFASQAVFRRTDSSWANAFKVTADDLRAHWTAGARLLPSYARLSPATGAYTFVPPDAYDDGGAAITGKVADQQALDAAAEFDDEAVDRLRRKLNACRWMLAPLFPRGLGFALDRTHLFYSPWSGSLTRGDGGGDVTLRMPAQAFKDAVAFGHVGDMGTTMFTVVHLGGNIDPRRVYLFFLVMSLHDYGHTANLRGWIAWLRHAVRVHRWRIPTPGHGAEQAAT